MSKLIRSPIVFAVLLYISSLSAHVKGTVSDGVIGSNSQSTTSTGVAKSAKSLDTNTNFGAAKELISKAVGDDTIAEAKGKIQQGGDKDGVTVMKEYITTELAKAKGAQEKARKALDLHISLSKCRKHTKADVKRATEAADYAKDAEQAMTDALNAAKAAEAVMAEMSATAAKEAEEDDDATKKEKAEKAKADAEEIKDLAGKVKAEVIGAALEKDSENDKDYTNKEDVECKKVDKAAQEEGKGNTKQNTKGSKTPVESVTAMTSTIPTVLITSVVFLYLYNW